MYEEYTIYGPYKRNDGRSHVCLVHKTNGSRKTISYLKYRMECILGRYLESYEEVHHKDEDVENNEDSNFEIRDSKTHKREHRLGTGKYNPEIFTCYVCQKKWLATSKQVEQRQRILRKDPNKLGPFCSRKCQGKVCN